jgi:hypothetical protein
MGLRAGEGGLDTGGATEAAAGAAAGEGEEGGVRAEGTTLTGLVGVLEGVRPVSTADLRPGVCLRG